jgi:4-amino-4-deoxy-L-arabinose transferase-like glycosyltransferase
MPVALRDVLIVAGVAAVVFFTNLGGYPLFDEDEPKNAVCGREMLQRGDWTVPTFNEELRTDKPILIYWLMLASYHWLGVSEFAARFGSSLLSVGTALGTYFLGRKLYDRQVGLLAAIVVCTCLMFSAVGRAVTPDATLVFCVTLCFCALAAGLSRKRKAESEEPDSEARGDPLNAGSSHSAFERLFALRYSLFAYATMGLAMLAKGPVGFLLPCTAIGLFGLCLSTREDLKAGVVTLGEGVWWRKSLRMAQLVFSPGRFLRTLWGMKLWIGVPVAFGIALPWYIAVGLETDGAWLAGFLSKHNVARFTSALENHRGLIVYYVPVLFAGTFPWSVFLPMAVRSVWRRIRDRAEDSEADLFLASWALTWLVFFSLAQTKLPNYILPIYPAVALILARQLIAWMRDRALSARPFRWECHALAAVGAAMMIGLLIVVAILLPGEPALALLGAIPIAASVGALRFADRDQRPRAVVTLAAGAVLLCLCMTGWAPLRLARYQDSPFFAKAAREATPVGAPEIASFEVFEPSLVFYHGRKVHRPNRPEDVAAYFDDHPGGFVLTRSDKLDRLPTDLCRGLVEVARQRRFLRRHDLVLLGHPTAIALGTSTNE